MERKIYGGYKKKTVSRQDHLKGKQKPFLPSTISTSKSSSACQSAASDEVIVVDVNEPTMEGNPIVGMGTEKDSCDVGVTNASTEAQKGNTAMALLASEIINSKNSCSNDKLAVGSVSEQNKNGAVNDNDNNDNHDGWIRVENKKNKKKSDKQHIYKGSAPRPEPVRGSNEAECILKVAQRMGTIFVSGFDPDTEHQTILDYLKSQNLNDKCICEKMKTVKQKKYSSFKLTVPMEKKNVYMDASLWPKDLIVNHFQNLQRQNVMARTLSSNTRQPRTLKD